MNNSYVARLKNIITCHERTIRHLETLPWLQYKDGMEIEITCPDMTTARAVRLHDKIVLEGLITEIKMGCSHPIVKVNFKSIRRREEQ